MKIVTRQEWGARPARHSVPLAATAIRELVFHYSGMDADEQSDHANCASRVRGIQRFHMDDPERQWSDIAYSWVVCKHGYVFEGRGWNVRTAATGNANSFTLACCFLGDDSAGRDDVTRAGRKALVDVARAFRARYPHMRRFAGHRDHMSTPCPGDEIHRYVTSSAFSRLVDVEDGKRLTTLRRWVLARRAAGWSWKRVKATRNWREFVRRGGR